MTNLLLNESCLDGLDAASVSVRFPTGLMDRICASLTFLLDRLICHCPFIRWESKLSMHWAKYGGKQTVELTNDCSDSNYSKNNGDKTCHGQDRDLMCSKFERAQVWTTFFFCIRKSYQPKWVLPSCCSDWTGSTFAFCFIRANVSVFTNGQWR